MSKKYQDLFAGSVLLIISCVLFFSTFGFQRLTDSKIGPEFMPQIIAISMAILSIILIINGIQALRLNNKSVKTNDVVFKRINKEVILTILLLLIYIAFMQALGFLIMTILYLFVQFYVYSPHNKKNILRFSLVAVVTSVSVYYLFTSIFYIRLPAGILG